MTATLTDSAGGQSRTTGQHQQDCVPPAGVEESEHPNSETTGLLDMLHISDLEFQYKEAEFQLQIPEFSVDTNQTLALHGVSGSGKTTFLNLVAGILPPHRGTIRINDTDLSTLSPTALRRFRITQVGMVFQDFELLEHLSVLDNILLPCRITAALRLTSWHRDRAAQLAQDVGIQDKLKRCAGRLSQGERQRVAICRALLVEPSLLLCDEPTGNLDPHSKAEVLDLLLGYVQRTGTTMVTVTHDHDTLSKFDRALDFKQFHLPREG